MDFELPKKHPRTDKGERRFDRTQMREKTYGHQIHRDYAAHYFRWGFVKNFIKGGMRVLDVGCGQDFPIAKIFRSSLPSAIPEFYLGIDLNKVKPPFTATWFDYIDEFDFTTQYKEIDGLFDVIVSYEVIEHMPKDDGRKLLKAMRKKVKEDGAVIISTPVYNGKHMAANHIHEYLFDELKEMIVECGFEVENVYGTFMTSNAMKKVCNKEEMKLINELHGFFGWDVLSNFIAPKYPEHASNCCWILRTAL